MHSMHPSQSTLLTGSPAMQLAQTAGIPIAGLSRLNTLVPSRENRQQHGHVSMICWIMPTDNANVAQSCALRCQFVMCNLHMQSWQAASLNAWLPMCMPLQMAGPACNHTMLCCLSTLPTSCNLWRQSGLRRKVSAHVLGPILLNCLSPSPLTILCSQVSKAV